jgi:holin-like protein
MTRAVMMIVVCLLLGDLINRLTALPLPGPVVGMLLLLALLVFRGGPDNAMKQTRHGLFHNMAMLFVPACAGLITELPLLSRDALPIAVAILASTVLGMAATSGAMHVLTRGDHE